MRAFGFEVSVRKAEPQVLSSVNDNRGFYPYGTFRVQEPFGGAYQRDIAWTNETVLAHHAVYACVTLIAADIAKLRIKLMLQDKGDIWSETRSNAFSPVLRKPNHFQTRIQFVENWMTSKLLRGNTYVLKEFDDRGRGEFEGVVRAMYVLDPSRVTPLVAPDGSVFYRLSSDNLAGIGDQIVPAEAIIHDRMPHLFHPLVGVSPIFACGAQANVGQKIQENAAKFFANDRTPLGILTAPGVITQVQADELTARWRARERAQIAVLGNGLTYHALTMSAEDSQVIEQLRYSGEVVCGAFHVPPFKIGIGAPPQYNNAELLDQRYYSDCLHTHIEHMEILLDEAFGLLEPKEGRQLGIELDLDGLMRMDSATQMDTLVKGVRGGVLTPNGARRKIDEQPLHGGDTIYMQHQDYPIEMVYERTDLNTPAPKPASAEPEPEPVDDDELDDEEKSIDLAALDDLIGNYEVAYV